MAAWRQRWKPLQLLIIFSLLFLTNQFEVRGDVVEKLSWDMAAELHTRGTSEIEELLKISSSLMNKQLLLQNHKDLDAFLVHFNKETMEDWWQSVSEISASVRQKVLVLTGSTDPSEGKMRQENSLDPQKRVPVSLKFLNNQSCVSELDGITEGEILVQNRQSGSGGSGSLPENLTLKLEPESAADFSLHGNTTLNSGGHLPKAALVHGPEEPNQENPSVYKVTNESDPVCSSRTAQRADEPIVEFDQQQILMLEDDEVVRRAAASLYDKHPTVSSVQLVGPQQRLQQVQGQALVLSEHSSLVLVGHGARDHSGEMRVSGYSYQDVARIIQSISRTSEKIQTTTVLACDAGSDRRFREALLKKLHEAGIETELHLWTAVVQVTETGEVISQDVSAGGAQWRSEDQTKKVVLTVGRKGEIRRKESDRTGHQVLTNQTNLLAPNKQNYRKDWPNDPKLFINPSIFVAVDQNNVGGFEKDFRILEALTWGLFHSEQDPELQRCKFNNLPDLTDHFVIGDATAKRVQGNTMEEKIKHVLQRCYVIDSGRQIRNVIRHYAKRGEDKPTYLMVANWIFEINPETLYVTPAGKRLMDQTEQEKENVKTLINSQQEDNKESYANIRGRIEKQEKKDYGYFIRSLFLGEPVALKQETDKFFSAWYFTASNIIESVRNFRTFPLVLMAMDMEEKHIEGRPDFWFNQHSMARGGTWIDETRRGFSGAATPSSGEMTKAQRDKIVEILKLEHLVFKNWEESLRGANKLKEMSRVAMHYRVLVEAQVNGFQSKCLDFTNRTKPENPSGAGPSASGGG